MDNYFIEYPCSICYLLIINMDLSLCQKHLGVFKKQPKTLKLLTTDLWTFHLPNYEIAVIFNKF